MTRRSTPRLLSLALVAGALLVSAATAADRENLSPEQRGKAATAALEVNGRRVGSAFCVSTDGLFISQVPPTDPAPPGVAVEPRYRLVFDDGFGASRIASAQLVRRYEKGEFKHLVLLHARGLDDLVALELNDKPPNDSTPATLVGYPLPAADSEDAYGDSVAASLLVDVSPEPGVKAGETRLRMVNAPFNDGNRGAPLLDAAGKVVGVASHAQDEGESQFAAPVAVVKELLKDPVLLISPTALPFRDRRREGEFLIEVKTYGDALPVESVALTLPHAGEDRSATIERCPEGWKARISPLPDEFDERRVSVQWLGEDESEPRDTAEIRTFDVLVGGRPTPIADLRRLERRGEQWIVTGVDERKTLASIVGLKTADSTGRIIDLSTARTIYISSLDGEPQRVPFKLAGTRGPETFVKQGDIVFQGAPEPLLREATFDPLAAPVDEIEFEITVESRCDLHFTPGGLLITRHIGLNPDVANGPDAPPTPPRVNGRVWQPRWFSEVQEVTERMADRSDVYPLPLGNDDWQLASLTASKFGETNPSKRGDASFYREVQGYTLAIWDNSSGVGVYRGRLVRRKYSPEEQAERAKRVLKPFKLTARIDDRDQLKFYQDHIECWHRRGAVPTDINLNGHAWNPEKDGLYTNPPSGGAIPKGIDFENVRFVPKFYRGWVMPHVFPDRVEIFIDDVVDGVTEYPVEMWIPCLPDE